MARFIIDSSVAAAWCFPDEQTSYTNAVLQVLGGSSVAIAPRLFAYELRNCVLIGLRRKRIQLSDATTFLESLQALPIQLTDPHSYNSLLDLSQAHSLTVYDAAYLDLAVREQLPIASLDRAIIQAASTLGISPFDPVRSI